MFGLLTQVIGITLVTNDTVFKVSIAYCKDFLDLAQNHCADNGDETFKPNLIITKSLIADCNIEFACGCEFYCETQDFREKLDTWLNANLDKEMLICWGDVPKCDQKYLHTVVDMMETGLGVADAKYIVEEISKHEKRI